MNSLMQLTIAAETLADAEDYNSLVYEREGKIPELVKTRKEEDCTIYNSSHFLPYPDHSYAKVIVSSSENNTVNNLVSSYHNRLQNNNIINNQIDSKLPIYKTEVKQVFSYLPSYASKIENNTILNQNHNKNNFINSRNNSNNTNGGNNNTHTSVAGSDSWEGSITRCICDFQHDDGYMICCDQCSVWQHVDCMGVDRANIPEMYLCELCGPRYVDKHYAIRCQARKRELFCEKADSSGTDTEEDIKPRKMSGNKSKRRQQKPLLSNTSHNRRKSESIRNMSLSQKNNRLKRNNSLSMSQDKLNDSPDNFIDKAPSPTTKPLQDNISQLSTKATKTRSFELVSCTNRYSLRLQQRLQQLQQQSVKLQPAVDMSPYSSSSSLSSGALSRRKDVVSQIVAASIVEIAPNIKAEGVEVLVEVDRDEVVMEFTGSVMLQEENNSSLSQTYILRGVETNVSVNISIDTSSSPCKLSNLIRRSSNPNSQLGHFFDKESGLVRFVVLSLCPIMQGSELSLPLHYNHQSKNVLKEERIPTSIKTQCASPLLPVSPPLPSSTKLQATTQIEGGRRRRRRKSSTRSSIGDEDSTDIPRRKSTTSHNETHKSTSTCKTTDEHIDVTSSQSHLAAVESSGVVKENVGRGEGRGGSSGVKDQRRKSEADRLSTTKKTQEYRKSKLSIEGGVVESKNDTASDKKLSREEKKLEAIMKAFERIEKKNEKKVQKEERRNAKVGRDWKVAKETGMKQHKTDSKSKKNIRRSESLQERKRMKKRMVDDDSDVEVDDVNDYDDDDVDDDADDDDEDACASGAEEARRFMKMKTKKNKTVRLRSDDDEDECSDDDDDDVSGSDDDDHHKVIRSSSKTSSEKSKGNFKAVLKDACKSDKASNACKSKTGVEKKMKTETQSDKGSGAEKGATGSGTERLKEGSLEKKGKVLNENYGVFDGGGKVNGIKPSSSQTKLETLKVEDGEEEEDGDDDNDSKKDLPSLTPSPISSPPLTSPTYYSTSDQGFTKKRWLRQAINDSSRSTDPSNSTPLKKRRLTVDDDVSDFTSTSSFLITTPLSSSSFQPSSSSSFQPSTSSFQPSSSSSSFPLSSSSFQPPSSLLATSSTTQTTKSSTVLTTAELSTEKPTIPSDNVSSASSLFLTLPSPTTSEKNSSLLSATSSPPSPTSSDKHSLPNTIPSTNVSSPLNFSSTKSLSSSTTSNSLCSPPWMHYSPIKPPKTTVQQSPPPLQLSPSTTTKESLLNYSSRSELPTLPILDKFMNSLKSSTTTTSNKSFENNKSPLQSSPNLSYKHHPTTPPNLNTTTPHSLYSTTPPNLSSTAPILNSITSPSSSSSFSFPTTSTPSLEMIQRVLDQKCGSRDWMSTLRDIEAINKSLLTSAVSSSSVISSSSSTSSTFITPSTFPSSSLFSSIMSSLSTSPSLMMPSSSTSTHATSLSLLKQSISTISSFTQETNHISSPPSLQPMSSSLPTSSSLPPPLSSFFASYPHPSSFSSSLSPLDTQRTQPPPTPSCTSSPFLSPVSLSNEACPEKAKRKMSLSEYRNRMKSGSSNTTISPISSPSSNTSTCLLPPSPFSILANSYNATDSFTDNPAISSQREHLKKLDPMYRQYNNNSCYLLNKNHHSNINTQNNINIKANLLSNNMIQNNLTNNYNNNNTLNIYNTVYNNSNNLPPPPPAIYNSSLPNTLNTYHGIKNFENSHNFNAVIKNTPVFKTNNNTLNNNIPSNTNHFNKNNLNNNNTYPPNENPIPINIRKNFNTQSVIPNHYNTINNNNVPNNYPIPNPTNNNYNNINKTLSNNINNPPTTLDNTPGEPEESTTNNKTLSLTQRLRLEFGVESEDPEGASTPVEDEEDDDDIPPPPPPREEASHRPSPYPPSHHSPHHSPTLSTKTKENHDEYHRHHSKNKAKNRNRNDPMLEERVNESVRVSERMNERMNERREEYEEEEAYYRARSNHRFYSKSLSQGDHNLDEKYVQYKDMDEKYAQYKEMDEKYGQYKEMSRPEYEVYDKKAPRAHDSPRNKHKNEQWRHHPYHLYHSPSYNKQAAYYRGSSQNIESSSAPRYDQRCKRYPSSSGRNSYIRSRYNDS